MAVTKTNHTVYFYIHGPCIMNQI